MRFKKQGGVCSRIAGGEQVAVLVLAPGEPRGQRKHALVVRGQLVTAAPPIASAIFYRVTVGP